MECNIRGLSVHYEEVGAGKPILILHGITGNSTQFMPDFEPVFDGRSGWRRLYPDVPGHGRTALPDWVQSHDDALDVLLEFMDTVAPGENFAVAGISWGGYLARGVVHHRPQQVTGMAMVVPVTSWDAETPDYRLIHADPAFVAALQKDDEFLLEMVVAQSPELLETLRAGFFHFAMPPDEKAVPLYGNQRFSFDPEDLPQPCPAPALMLMGRQDNVVGYKQAWSILEHYPRATFAVLDRAGHFLAMEQTPLFRALMGEWLDRVEEYGAQKAET